MCMIQVTWTEWRSKLWPCVTYNTPKDHLYEDRHYHEEDNSDNDVSSSVMSVCLSCLSRFMSAFFHARLSFMAALLSFSPSFTSALLSCMSFFHVCLLSCLSFFHICSSFICLLSNRPLMESNTGSRHYKTHLQPLKVTDTVHGLLTDGLLFSKQLS